MDQLTKRSAMVARRVKQQIDILTSLQVGIDKGTVRSEVKRLDDFLKELDTITGRLVQMSQSDSQANGYLQTQEELETLAVSAKQDAYKTVSDGSSSAINCRIPHVFPMISLG